MTFAVGDRVECHYPSGEWDGELGTVVCVRDSSIGVENCWNAIGLVYCRAICCSCAAP